MHPFYTTAETKKHTELLFSTKTLTIIQHFHHLVFHASPKNAPLPSRLAKVWLSRTDESGWKFRCSRVRMHKIRGWNNISHIDVQHPELMAVLKQFDGLQSSTDLGTLFYSEQIRQLFAAIDWFRHGIQLFFFFNTLEIQNYVKAGSITPSTFMMYVHLLPFSGEMKAAASL